MNIKRIPGQPERKYKYIKNLDEKQFPFLIADILYFIFEHREIKILDGPGDGKRDIISKNKDNKTCITQCKFHTNFTTSISSRETDEIAIALTKFNIKVGIFATTGKLSPQAKREFLDNFPNFELSFIEGVDIVDLVLSSPLLSSVWVRNYSIKLTSKPLLIPFILRDIIEDKPIEVDLANSNRDFSFKNDYIPLDYFLPYRKPNYPSLKETGNLIACQIIIFHGPIYIYNIDSLIDKIINLLLPILYEQNKLLSIRMGIPFFAKIFDNEIKEKIKLEREPITFIVNGQEKYSEKEYTIPLTCPEWVFPQRFGHLESPWAAWFSHNINTCLQVELRVLFNVQDDVYSSNMKDIHLQKLNKSLFFIITREQYNNLNSLLQEDEFPNWNCEYGFDGYLIGWIHPYLLDEDYLKSYKMENDRIVPVEDEIQNESFEEKLKTIKGILVGNNFQICLTKKAINISETTSEPLFIEPSLRFFNSAYLYHYFEEIPSPIYLKNRIYNFICIWDIPSYEFNSDTVEFISQEKFNSRFNFEVKFDIETTDRRMHKFARLDIIYNVPENFSSVNFLKVITPEVASIIEIIDIKLKEKHSDALVKTEYFWNQEIGIYFK